MRKVICSMGVTLDGFIVGPDGGFAWGAPGEELFAFIRDEFRSVGAHLLGRRVYETMLYWETAADDPALGPAELAWAEMWNALPKVVFSRTLTQVQGSYRLATRSLADEIAHWQAEPGTGDLAVAGADLGGQAAALGLIDEYQVRVHPVLVGGGRPFFPQAARRVDLELVESRAFGSGEVFLRYRVRR